MVIFWGYKYVLSLSDSNKFLTLATTISSFMWFKGIKMKYNATINIIVSKTFRMLLIHANSNLILQ